MFHAARSAADPAAYLAVACAGDPDLRQRVERLLAADAALAAAIDPAPTGPTAEFHPAVEPRRVVAGRYTLREQVGVGGMGEVWVADQTEPIRRRVALKLIKAGMDSEQVLARFEAERQALALMDHPNIAKVLDAGTTSEGRPFFAMELVKGTPITQFCDARRLRLRERLELFVPVCQAIQHAHQKGVIHRDVKPSNVLVALHDERPVPKVIDFGVAKAVGQQLTERTIYTGLGALVGTPAYMAPEQATLNQLDVDTRADVYALGVLLYELLTGSPPFEPARLKTVALDEVLRLVREEEPPRPSQRLSTSEARASIAAVRQTDPVKLSRLLRGELDWIVMKALEKDRTRRYETATGLAGDVMRYLADEPVEARPPTAGYRLRKFARRHRAAVNTAALATFLLVAGAGVSIWQAVRATRAEKQTAAERDTAEAARRQTQAALDTVTDDALADLLAKKSALSAGDRQFLRKVLALYDELAATGGDGREARLARATGYRKVAAIRIKLGENAEAEAAARQAVEEFRRLGKEDPADFRFALGEELALREERRGRMNRSRPEDEIRLSREAVAAADRAFALAPAEPDVRAARGFELCELGFSLNLAGDTAAAVEQFDHGIELLRALVRDFPDRSQYRAGLAAALSNAAPTVRRAGRLTEGEALAREALAEMDRLCTDEPDHEQHFDNRAITWGNLGAQLRAQKRLDEAEAAYRTGVEAGDQAVARFPSAGHLRVAVAVGRLEYADLLAQRRKFDAAIAEYRKALAELDRVAATDPEAGEIRARAGESGNGLAIVLVGAGRTAEAEGLLRDLIARFERQVKALPTDAQSHGQLAIACNTLGGLLVRGPGRSEGEKLLGRAVAELEEVVRLAPTNTQFWNNLGASSERLGLYLMSNGRFAEAEPVIRTQIAAYARLVELDRTADSPRRLLIFAHQSLGKAFQFQNKPDAALACQRDAVAVAEARLADAPNDPGRRKDHCQVAAALANMLRQTGKPDAAADVLLPLIDRQRKVLSGRAPQAEDLEGLAMAVGALFRLRGAQRRLDEARTLGREALDIREKLVLADPKSIDNWLELSRMASTLGLQVDGQVDSAGRLALLTRAREAGEKAVEFGGPKSNLLIELAGDEVNEADALRLAGKPAAGLPGFARAIGRLEPFAKATPPIPLARPFYINAHLCRALAFDALGRNREAIADLETALALDAKSLSATDRIVYMGSLVAVGRLADAVAQAEVLSRPADAPPDVVADCALTVAKAAAAEQNPDARAKREQRAVELLQRARAGGQFRTPENNERMRKDPALQPLKSRDDFQRFLADLDKERSKAVPKE